MIRQRATPDSAILAGFESLGDNCELAAVQRLHGVEPLDLFRWSSTSVEMLVDALDHDLEGLDDPAMLSLDITPALPGRDREHVLRHRRFSNYSHTFARADKVDSKIILEREVKRLTLLRRKFLFDVGRGRRTYVFRTTGATDAQADQLLSALRRRAPTNRLLVVRQASAAAPAGQVFARNDGWLDGRLTHLAPEDDGFLADVDGWRELLHTAHTLIASHGRPYRNTASATDRDPALSTSQAA